MTAPRECCEVKHDAGIRHTYLSISGSQLRGMRKCISESRLEEKVRPLRCTADAALHTMGAGAGEGEGKWGGKGAGTGAKARAEQPFDDRSLVTNELLWPPAPTKS